MLLATNIIINCIGGGKSSYRSDIDGLRALACLAVVFYHAFPKYMVGGFVGVDIFFVISGYLISSILYRNLYDTENPGYVNIVDFYIRRVRRIFPALIAVLIFVLVVGWFILLPIEFKFLGKHVFGGSSYTNNLISYLERDNYFAQDSNRNPLLHLWSLGVEEQFYLIFPIFLWGLYKLKLNFIKSLTVFTVISFLLNLYFVLKGNGSYSFYMPWTRFWELSVGAILAYVVMFKPNITNKLQDKETTANALSIVGLLLILVSYLVIPQDMKFPGYRAALPVLGALCIIAAGQKGIVNKKILSSKIFIFFGLISYPLYLWHWPLLSLGWICEGQQPDRWIRLALVGISIILATLTFYFIEPQLRYGKAPEVKALLLFCVLTFLGAIGIFVHHTEGAKFRIDNQLSAEEILINQKTIKYHDGYSIDDEYLDNCKDIYPNWNDGRIGVTCALQNKTGKNDIALLGDSHVAHLFYGLVKIAKMKGSNHSFALFPAPSNSPFFNLAIKHDEYGKYFKWINEAYDYILKRDEITLVIMSHIIMGSEYDLLNESNDYYSGVYEGAVRSFDLLAKKGKSVIYVIDNPTLPFNPSTVLWSPLKKADFDRDVYWGNQKVKEYNRAVNDAAKLYKNVFIVDPTDIFCDENSCYSKDKVSHKDLYMDVSHLGIYGSEVVSKLIFKEIEVINKDKSQSFRAK